MEHRHSLRYERPGGNVLMMHIVKMTDEVTEVTSERKVIKNEQQIDIKAVSLYFRLSETELP